MRQESGMLLGDKAWFRYLIRAVFMWVFTTFVLFSPRVLTAQWQWVPPFEMWLYIVSCACFLWILATLIFVPAKMFYRDLSSQLSSWPLRVVCKIMAFLIGAFGSVALLYISLMALLFGVFTAGDYYGSSAIEIEYCSKTPGRLCTSSGGFPDLDDFEVHVFETYGLLAKHTHDLPHCRELSPELIAGTPLDSPPPVPCAPGGSGFIERSGQEN